MEGKGETEHGHGDAGAHEGTIAADYFLSESDVAAEGNLKQECETDAESAAPWVVVGVDARAPGGEPDGDREHHPDGPGNPELEGHPKQIDGVEDHLDEEAKKGIVWPEKAAALKNFVKEKGGIMVSKMMRRLSGKTEDLEQDAEEGKCQEDARKTDKPLVEEGGNRPWSLSAMKESIDQLPEAKEEYEGVSLNGRITFYSKSGCQDCRSVRSFLKQRKLKFVEVNLDVFPHRNLELEERTGTSSVPQVFFNSQLVGGIDELNALQHSGEFEEKLKDVMENSPPPTAPAPPVYGEDEPESAVMDEFAQVVRCLREKVLVKDRFLKYRVFQKCFIGSEAIDFISEDQYLERDEAVEYGRKIANKHFFHHVLHEHSFEDGNNFYRFFEHDPTISTKCFNFTGTTNDYEPKLAAEVGRRLSKLIMAIYESHISDDGKCVNYRTIATSEEFRRYVKMIEDLQRVDLTTLTREETLSLFINIYNAMVIHAIIVLGRPNGPLERRKFFGEFQYVIGGYPYSLSAVQNGILRANQRPPYTLTKPFGAKDKRLPVCLKNPDPLIHFALCSGTKSSPAIRCYSDHTVDAELRFAARAFFEDGGILIDSETKTISLTKVLKWYSSDFGKNEHEVLQWVVNHVDPTKAELILSLLEDRHLLKVNYLPYDWSLNI